MMRHRPDLTDKELTFSCGTRLVFTHLFLGIMVGYLAWIPASLIYASLQIGFPRLPSGGASLAITTGICGALGLMWAYAVSSRFRDLSFRFNSKSIKSYRDNVLRAEILWADVESVKPGIGYIVLSRHGSTIEVPFGALISERYENRALKNQLAKYEKPHKIPSPKRFAWIGGVGICIGVPLFAGSKRPYEVFANADGLSSAVWLGILPSVVGAVLTVIGVIYVSMALVLLGDRKKSHTYKLTDEGILEGNKLLRWAEIRQVSSLGLEDMQIQFWLHKGPKRLIDCQRYVDGAQLRDSILSARPILEMQNHLSVSERIPAQTITAKSWAGKLGPIGCISAFAILGLVIVFLTATGRMALNKPSDAMSFEALGVLSFLLMGSVAVLACYQVDLSESEICLRRVLFPRSRITFVEIAAVEIRSNQSKNGPVDLMTVRSKKATITFSSNLEKYDLISNFILERVPNERVKYS